MAESVLGRSRKSVKEEAIRSNYNRRGMITIEQPDQFFLNNNVRMF